MNALTSQNNGRVIFERVSSSALQPECTRKPTAACFMEASAAEELEP